MGSAPGLSGDWGRQAVQVIRCGVFVKQLLLSTLDALARIFLLRGARVTVGSGSQVSWRKLRANPGSLKIGSGCIVHARIDIDDPGGVVTIGNDTYIGASHIVCHTRVAIGDDVIISWGVTIADHDSHSLDARQRAEDVALWRMGRKSWTGVGIRPVHIGNRAWIGFGASVLKGVTVGEGAVVGANAVVTRDVPPYSLVAGNPARIVRRLDYGAA